MQCKNDTRSVILRVDEPVCYEPMRAWLQKLTLNNPTALNNPTP